MSHISVFFPLILGFSPSWPYITMSIPHEPRIRKHSNSITSYFLNKLYIPEVREVAQQVRALIAILEDLS